MEYGEQHVTLVVCNERLKDLSDRAIKGELEEIGLIG